MRKTSVANSRMAQSNALLLSLSSMSIDSITSEAFNLHGSFDAAQQRAYSHHPHRQPATPARADEALRDALARRGRRFRRKSIGPATRHCRKSFQSRSKPELTSAITANSSARDFFLHVRHRMTGFGGSWKRWPRADVENYPIFKRSHGAAERQQGHGQQLRAAESDRRHQLHRRRRKRRVNAPISARCSRAASAPANAALSKRS